MTISRIRNIANTTSPGLVPKLPGTATEFLNGIGAFSTPSGSSQTGVIGFVLDGAGAVLTTGYKTALFVPTSCTVTQLALLSNDPASTVANLELDVLVATTFPPSGSIVAAAPPTLTATNHTVTTVLTGWTTTIPANSYIGVEVTTVTTAIKATLQLMVNK